MSVNEQCSRHKHDRPAPAWEFMSLNPGPHCPRITRFPNVDVFVLYFIVAWAKKCFPSLMHTLMPAFLFSADVCVLRCRFNSPLHHSPIPCQTPFLCPCCAYCRGSPYVAIIQIDLTCIRSLLLEKCTSPSVQQVSQLLVTSLFLPFITRQLITQDFEQFFTLTTIHIFAVSDAEKEMN